MWRNPGGHEGIVRRGYGGDTTEWWGNIRTLAVHPHSCREKGVQDPEGFGRGRSRPNPSGWNPGPNDTPQGPTGCGPPPGRPPSWARGRSRPSGRPSRPTGRFWGAFRSLPPRIHRAGRTAALGTGSWRPSGKRKPEPGRAEPWARPASPARAEEAAGRAWPKWGRARMGSRMGAPGSREGARAKLPPPLPRGGLPRGCRRHPALKIAAGALDAGGPSGRPRLAASRAPARPRHQHRAAGTKSTWPGLGVLGTRPAAPPAQPGSGRQGRGDVPGAQIPR